METVQQILAIAAVFGLLGCSVWWLRRRGLAHVAGMAAFNRRKPAGLLQRVDRISLSPTHSLHLVRMADRAILIAASPAGCQVVESSPWSHIEASQTEPRS